MSLQLAILASGSGSNAQTMFEAVEKGILDANIRLVFSNRCDAKVLERAKKYNIPTYCLDHKAFATREEFDKKMVQVIQEHGADTIAMAGYMRLVTPYFLQAFPNRILNIHPAILPSFVGAHGARDAVAYGVKFSGCSVHFVSEEMDAGPLIIQAVVPNSHLDTEESLQSRIHEVEHKIYIQALQWFAQNRLELHGRVVHVLAEPSEQELQNNEQVNTTNAINIDSSVLSAIPQATFLGLNSFSQKNTSQISENESSISEKESAYKKFALGAMIYPPLEKDFL